LFYIILEEVVTASVVDTPPSGFFTWFTAGLVTEVPLLGLFTKTIFEDDY